MDQSHGEDLLGAHNASDSVKSGGANRQIIIETNGTQELPAATSSADSNGVNEKTGPGVADMLSSSGENLPGPSSTAVTSIREPGPSGTSGGNDASPDTNNSNVIDNQPGSSAGFSVPSNVHLPDANDVNTTPGPSSGNTGNSEPNKDAILFAEWKKFKMASKRRPITPYGTFVCDLARSMNLPLLQVQKKIRLFEKKDVRKRFKLARRRVGSGRRCNCPGTEIDIRWPSPEPIRSRLYDLYFTDMEIEEVRDCVLQIYGERGRWLTVPEIMDVLRAKVPVVCRESESAILKELCRALDFKFGKPFPSSKESYISETPEVAKRRLKFLESMRMVLYARVLKPVVYVAETWLEWNDMYNMMRHVGLHSLVSPMFRSVASSRGRVILTAAAYADSGPIFPLLEGRKCGWLDFELIEDLHNNFKIWFIDLCDILTEPSVIVMDSSQHHTVKIQRPHEEVTRSVIKEIALERGHRVIFMPKRHIKYNPMGQLLMEAKLKALRAGPGDWEDLFNRLYEAVWEYSRPLPQWLHRVYYTQYTYSKDLAEMRRLNSLIVQQQQDEEPLK